MSHAAAPGATRSQKTRRPRPTSRPSPLRAAVRRHRNRPVDPRSKQPKGQIGAFTHLRRAVWSWWPWSLLALWLVSASHWLWAAAATLMALLSHLLTPRSQPPRFGLEHEFAVNSTEFLATVVGATGVPFIAGNAFEVLNNGDAFYPRMLADIRAAQVSVAIEAYIYWAGEVGAEFAAALAERATAGVRVMVLLDAVGSSDIGDDTLATLEDGGCRVAWYNPLHWNTIGRYNNRTHRKSLIVDGMIAYTGGAGIADHWRGDARGPDEWRDIQVRLEGPAVMPLQSGFAHNWQRTTCELVSGDMVYPVIEPRGPHAVQAIMSSPESGGSSVQTMYYLAIVCARHTIFIANPYFVPDAVAIETLVEAKGRGLDVRVMVSGNHNDNWWARKNSVRLYGRLLEAGIQILEYNRSMLHHKFMVVDGHWITIGTANFDNRSFAHNEESNVCLYERKMAAKFEKIFLDDVPACGVVTLAAWRQRGWSRRAGELVAGLLEDQV